MLTTFASLHGQFVGLTRSECGPWVAVRHDFVGLAAELIGNDVARPDGLSELSLDLFTGLARKLRCSGVRNLDRFGQWVARNYVVLP